MSDLNDIKWIDLPSIIDERGILTAIESKRDIPIEICRLFYVHNVISDRGGHAHIDTNQVLISISGEFTLTITDGKREHTYQMNDPTKGIYIPKMIFINMFNFSENAVCFVIADTYSRLGMFEETKRYVFGFF